MRKLFVLISLLFIFFQGALSAQVYLRVELQSDSITYIVKLRPEVSYSAPLNTTNNGQITLVVPSGGVEIGNVTNIKGLWSEGNIIRSPEENPTMDYLMFTLQSGTTDIPYVAGQEVDLFSFQNTGTYTGDVQFLAAEDPFFPPNSQSVNIGNQISVLGAGFTNAYSGTYTVTDLESIDLPMDSVGIDTTLLIDTVNTATSVITIDSVQLKGPSDCNLTDGSIEIIATHQDSSILQYSVDGGITWLDTNLISNLESGVTYNIQVRDNIGLNFAEHGRVELPAPRLANVTKTEITSPSCDTTGAILIEAVNLLSNAPLRFTIDNGETWVDSIGNFQNITAGTYQPMISAVGITCIDELEAILIIAEECGEEEGEGEEGAGAGEEGAGTGQENAGTGEEEEEDGDNGESVDFDWNNGVFPANVDCKFAYVLEATDSVFTVSIVSDTTFRLPVQNTTSSMQISIKVPTGTFMDIQDSVTYFVDGFPFNFSRTDAPEEAPNFDFLSFGLATKGANAIAYEKGLKTPLFSFKSNDNCTNELISLVDNENEVSISAVDVRQQLTILGMGESDSETCISTANITDCGITLPAVDSTNNGEIVDTTNNMEIIDSTNNGEIVDTTNNMEVIDSTNNGEIVDTTNNMEVIDSTNNGEIVDTTNNMEVIDSTNNGEMIDTTTNMEVVDSTNTGGEGFEEGPEITDITRDTMIVSIPLNTMTTICLDSLIDLDTVSTALLCNAEGELIVTARDNSRCIEIEPKSSFNESEYVCVVHCDTQNVCDTTVVNICPKVSLDSDLSICLGESIRLNPVGGSGIYQWTTTGNIDSLTNKTPTIQPTSTTNYVVENTTPNGCKSSDTLLVNVMPVPIISEIDTILPTDCENNGRIAITIVNPMDDLQYSIDNGKTYQDSAIFLNLWPDNYQVTVQNTTTNCAADSSQTVELRGEEDVIIENVALTHPSACKEEKGRIMVMISTGAAAIPEYSIDSGATWSPRAVFDSLEVGQYHLQVRVPGDSCITSYRQNPIQLAIPEQVRIINGLADRNFCTVEEKIIQLSINEMASDFTITGGDFTDALITDSLFTFKAITTADTTIFTITLTGESGCSASGDIQVTTRACEAVQSCGFFNGLDTLRAVIEDSVAVVCLPISDMDISEFEFLKEGISYEMTFGECMEASIFYGFNAESLGTPPFLLKEWIVDADTLKDFEFEEVAALVNKMNEFDQQANWVVVDDFGFIGISADKNYGPLNLLHVASNTTLELQLNNMNIAFQSLLLEGSGIQTFIVRDTMNNCEDPLVIKIDDQTPVTDSVSMDSTMTNQFPLDTLKVTTLINTSLMNQCLTNSSTILDSISIDDCGTPQNGSLLIQDNYCFNYTPNLDYTGQDAFCIVICSPTICDTTHVQVTVQSDSLEVFTGLSPNGDGKNDVFKIANIEKYPDNSVEIFNRWGNRVYKKEKYNNDWNGSFENAPLPSGVYFYLLKITDNGKEEVRSGYLQIMR